MEFLDIVDENGEPTGETTERENAHKNGILHRTSHLWLIRKQGSKTEILLQKRSDDKDSFPGCFDISSAGHIPAGCGFEESAIRELHEELGIIASTDELHFCGRRRFKFKKQFHGKMFWDNQVTNVYYMTCATDENDFVLQQSEVSAVKWFDFFDCIKLVKENKINHCIFEDELTLLKNTLMNDGILQR